MHVKYVVLILGGGLLLTVCWACSGRQITSTQRSSQPLSAMNDTITSDDTQQQPTNNSQAAASQEQSTEMNPLKKYQDLVNSPTTPDGDKVVAAVAAASTVTVAAVANWLMKRKK